ncbi:mitochondrial uncoupling protein 4 isoform 5-T5 [Glossophaga mutica]
MRPERRSNRGGAQSRGLHFPEALWAPCCFRLFSPLDHRRSLGLLGRLRVRRTRLTEQGEGHGLCRCIRGLKRGHSGRVAGQPPHGAPARRATFPLDLTKTRLQMQGEAALARLGDSAREAAPYRGMVRTALGIVQEEGFFKLWQGVTPAIYRHVVYSGGRMVTYEHLREVVFGKSEDKHYPLWKSVIGGMMAGVVGQFLANPTDLVKVQMQMEGKRKLEGKPLRFRGVHHAFAKILAEGGIRGLWAGWVPNIQRAALVNMGDLTTYDTVKHYLVLNTPLEDNIMTHGLSSLCSGLVASILGTPADVIKSRIMNQPRDKQGRGLLYKSSTDCLVQAVQGEGFMSLYKGFLPSWLRMC